MMAQGHLIMSPILKLPHQHQSGSYLEELHDLRLCRPPWIKPFITCWHPCPVLNVYTPWESDETSETWWVMDNLHLCKGWPTVPQRARGRSCPPNHANCFAGQTPPSQHSPRLLAPLTWGGRQPAEEKSPAADGATCFGWPIQALCPCHMSLTLVFWSDNTSRQGLSVFSETQKGKGEEKLTRPLFAPAQILWKSQHQEKNQIKSQQKQSTPTKKLSCTPTVPLTTLFLIKHPGPPGGDKKKRPYPQKVCKESACTKAICNFTKWQT